MPAQITGYSSTPAKAYPGMLADDGAHDIGSATVDAAAPIPPGVLVLRTTGGDYAADVPAPLAVAAPSSIKTNIASSASPQALVVGDFNGSIGAGKIPLAAKIVLVLSSNAHWILSTATLSGLDENGIPVSEPLTIPAGGNTTLTSSRYYSRITGLNIPAQGGGAGTATLGTSASVTLDGGEVLGISLREHKGRLVPSASDNELWDDGSEMPVLRQGRVFVKMENAFRVGECPLVRLVAVGGEQRGAFRGSGDTDSGDSVPFRRARCLNSGAAEQYAVLDVRLI